MLENVPTRVLSTLQLKSLLSSWLFTGTTKPSAVVSAHAEKDEAPAMAAPTIDREKITNAYLPQANSRKISLLLPGRTGSHLEGSESLETTLPLPICLECQEE